MATSKKSVIVVSVVTALCLLGDSMLYIALPLYYREMGLSSLWEVGLLLSINRLVRLPLNPLAGWVLARIPLQWGLTLAVVLGAVTTLGYGVASGFIVWLLLRSLWGLAWSFLRIGGLAAVLQASDNSNRGEMMGLYNGLYRLGSLGGMIVGGIAASIIGLPAIALLFGVCSLVGLPLVRQIHLGKITPESRVAENTAVNGSKGWLAEKGILLLMVSGFVVACVFQGVVTSTLSVVIRQFGEEISLWGIMLAASAWSGLIQGARWAWEPFLVAPIGRWSDGERGRIPLFLGFLLMAGVLMFFVPFPLPFPLWLVVALLLLVTATALTTLTDALASDEASQGKGVAKFTYFSIAQDLGAAIGPLLGYLLLELPFGLIGLYFLGGSALIALSLAWSRRRKAISRQRMAGVDKAHTG